MSCGYYNKQKQKDYEHIRSLAKKCAVMEGTMYILYMRDDGIYSFVREGSAYSGKFIEFIHYL